MKRTLNLIAGAAGALALIAPVVLEPALAAGGDFGPNTCLNGYVWREAFVGDVVCVTPDRRSLAARDNAAAASRRAPGAYGPNTCGVQGFVWREARPSDLVCVTVQTRSTTKAENAVAAGRRNSVVLTLSRWVSPNTTTCDGNVCTTENDSATRHRIVVTNINVGKATLRLVRTSDRRILKLWNLTSSPSGGPGGRVAFKTNQLVCSGTPNAYFRIQDPSSGRWSARQFVRTGCVAL